MWTRKVRANEKYSNKKEMSNSIAYTKLTNKAHNNFMCFVKIYVTGFFHFKFSFLICVFFFQAIFFFLIENLKVIQKAKSSIFFLLLLIFMSSLFCMYQEHEIKEQKINQLLRMCILPSFISKFLSPFMRVPLLNG